MPFLSYFLLLCCYLVSGYGILRCFNVRLKKAYTITLSLLLGLALASFLPFLLQLLYIPITAVTVFGSLILATLLLNIPTIRDFSRAHRSDPSRNLRTLIARPFRSLFSGPFRSRAYEVPYWLLLAFIIFVSIWRCYYYPPTSRDALSGPEAIAEFTIREHTMVNSFFHIDLWSTNNQFKSPFLVSLQVIYKLAGFPFGQVWLCIIFVALTVFLYHALREKLHPLLAGTLLLLFTIAPEPYAYTFMILYDYSNMVYFFLGLYFLFRYFSTPSLPSLPSLRTFYFSGLLLGIATYIRSETLILNAGFIPVILFFHWRNRHPLKKILVSDLLFLLPTVIGYYLPVQLYINHYLPIHYDVGGLIDSHAVLSGLFRRYSDIFTRLLTGEFSIRLWGYIYYITAILFVAEGLFLRRFTREAGNWLYAMAVVYLGLGAIGWLFPVMDLTDSTKRGLFKLLPLTIFFLANSQILVRFSVLITRWEQRPSIRRPSRQPATTAKPVLTKTGKTVASRTAQPPSSKHRRRKK